MQTDWDSRGGDLPAHRSTFGDSSSKAHQKEVLAEPRDQIIQLIKRGIDEPDFAAGAFDTNFSFQAEDIRQFSFKRQRVGIFWCDCDRVR